MKKEDFQSPWEDSELDNFCDWLPSELLEELDNIMQDVSDEWDVLPDWENITEDCELPPFEWEDEDFNFMDEDLDFKINIENEIFDFNIE